MATLAQRLKTLLEAALQDGFAELETLPNGHVSGDVVSAEFAGKDFESRRLRIRKVLESSNQAGDLTSEDLANVSTLLTYTPDEWSAVTES